MGWDEIPASMGMAMQGFHPSARANRQKEVDRNLFGFIPHSPA